MRGVFLLVYADMLSGISIGEISQAFYHALRLDMAAACYLMAIPLLIFVLQLCFKHKIIDVFLRIFIAFEFTLAALISFAEINIYREWRSKLNYKALAYLNHPDEIFRTATSSQIIFLVIGTVALVAGFYFLFSRFVVKPPIIPQKRPFIKAALSLLLGSGLCFTGMRGGLDAIPITQSAAYFSRYDILNDAAVNPHWNLAINIADFGSLGEDNSFSFMDSQTAEDVFNELRKVPKDTTVFLLNKNNINIVIILLESWGADVIEPFSGSDEIAPSFNAMAKDGILFTNFYANGHRSQQAICSMLSGFPSVPDYDITDNHSKYKHLPSLVSIINKSHHTSFYFGGNLDYGNIRAFLLHVDFDEIVEGKNIDKKTPRGKLGIHDQYMLDYQMEMLDKKQEPFFNILFTLSSHSPYDQPKIVKELDWDTKELTYLNSVKYTDYCLGQYFEKVKSKPWYNNTMFILLGDHYHPSHIDRSYYDADYQKIPMLWYGDVIKEEFRGTQCGIIGSQVDIPQTLLAQLNINTDIFQWGKNMFNPYSNKFAYYEIVKGFGWISPEGSYAFSNGIRQFTGDDAQQESLLFVGQAYAQRLFFFYKGL